MYIAIASKCMELQFKKDLKRKMHFSVVIAIVFLFYSGSSSTVVLSTTTTPTPTTVVKNNLLVLQTERLALFEFKKGITQDPFRVTSSWNDSTDLCNWYGITCSSSQSNQSVLILNLENQQLVGILPPSIGNLTSLTAINLRNNSFHGTIPQEIGSLSKLQYLNLTRNSFTGEIPQSLSGLRGMQVLDVSSNNLFGKVPEYLSFLKSLNLSYNDFNGEVPTYGIFADIIGLSVVGNNKLCGGITELNLPACSLQQPRQPRRKSKRKVHNLKGIILLAFGCLILLKSFLFAAYYLVRKLRNKTAATKPTSKDAMVSVSYEQLFKSTDGFSKDNLIGVGSFGSVYKGNLYGSSTKLVAVKVLNLQQVDASNSFIPECEALKNIRHRNLVNIKTACSSVDSSGNDFKALVFELVTNGNLEQWLHPQASEEKQFKSLSLNKRLNIAIDVASGLEYLHHHSPIPIVHCDLKPSNILLDDDMMARVSDFSLARFLLRRTTDNSSAANPSVGLKGSIGYISPEYGMGGRFSMFGDIYSYGILLLEMFTGKRPTDDMFKDGLNLHNFATASLPNRVMEIVDPLLLLALSEEEHKEDFHAKYRDDEAEQEAAILGVENCSSNVDSRIMHECLVSVIRIGISCSMPLPNDRTVIKDVVSQLHDIKKSFLESLN